MANELDETDVPVSDAGNDVRVIAKKIDVTVGTGSKIFDVIWWFLPPVIGGVIWLIMKRHARNYFLQLQQKLQHDASQIDNYLEQRVQILQNCVKLVDRAMEFDETVFTKIAAYRSGMSDEQRNEQVENLAAAEHSIRLCMENYPDLKAHGELQEAMRQNAYLQKEITAAREVYNDTVHLWNTEIFHWPTKQIVAAKAGYSTRIPFAADSATREAARSVFF